MPASQISPDDTVAYFATCGHLDPAGEHWLVPVHAWVYKPLREGFALKAARAVFRRALGLKGKHQETTTFQERSSRFLVDNRPDVEIVVQIGDREHRLPVTGPNGHSRHVLRISVKEVGDAERLRFHTVLPAGDSREITGEVPLLPSVGISVISDIDDTIKISNVRDRKELMKNTFVRPFEPAAGMAALYRKLADAGASFHYVTSAPWQLYHHLELFRAEHGYPAGSMHMKKFRLKDRSFFDLFASPTKTKPKHIEPLLEALPQRRFALIGDSGEEDPEIYADMANRYPTQVRSILIRNVTDEDAASKRMRKAFRNLPAEAWQIFASPEELNLSRVV